MGFVLKIQEIVNQDGDEWYFTAPPTPRDVFRRTILRILYCALFYKNAVLLSIKIFILSVNHRFTPLVAIGQEYVPF
jgi:hypothetical protein